MYHLTPEGERVPDDRAFLLQRFRSYKPPIPAFGRHGTWESAVATGLRNLLLRATPKSQVVKQLRENARFALV